MSSVVSSSRSVASPSSFTYTVWFYYELQKRDDFGIDYWCDNNSFWCDCIIRYSLPHKFGNMRFCKQHDQYSCGAIAILNVAKFLGYKSTYKDLPYYRDLIGCTKEFGTFTRSISILLGRASRRSWKKSKEFLQEGNCIMVFTCYQKLGHFYLIVTDKNGCFITVNRYPDCSSSLQILPHAVARLLKCAKRTWYIEREYCE